MITTPSDKFTRPANTTQYAAGDLVANSTTAADVVALKFSTADAPGARGAVVRARLHKSAASDTAAKFSLHLWSTAPTPTNGDNGALAVDTSLTYLGAIAFDMTSGAMSATDGLAKVAAPAEDILFDNGADRHLYGLLEADDTYTPASGETFTATLEIEG